MTTSARRQASEWIRDAGRTFAGGSVRAERVSWGAFALVTSLGVQAGSPTTQHGVPLALVDVCWGREGEVRRAGPACGFGAAFTNVAASVTHAVLHHHEAALVALETFALEAAGGVDAGAGAAQVRRDATLVDVWKTTAAERPMEAGTSGEMGLVSLIPVQFLSSAVRANPLLQRHLKLPMVFRQFPYVHRLWNTLHSFTSAGESEAPLRRQEVIGRDFTECWIRGVEHLGGRSRPKNHPHLTRSPVWCLE